MKGKSQSPAKEMVFASQHIYQLNMNHDNQ